MSSVCLNLKSYGNNLASLFSDRGRVVGGLPDVVTIMEEKVRISQSLLLTIHML